MKDGSANPRRLVPVLPTVLTLGNLSCGFIAMAKTVDAMHVAADGAGPLDPLFATKIVQACWYIVAAMVFDALDGRVARMMHQASAFGTQLDSLADMVTFGVAPALMAKVVYEHTMAEQGLRWHPGIVTLLCSLFLVGAALRLARFTITTDTDEASHDTFLGLPSPAAAATIVTACFFAFVGRSELGLSEGTAAAIAEWLLGALPAFAAALGLLMISRVRYVHLLQRYVKSRGSGATIVRIVLAVWLIVFFHEWALFAAAIVYVVGGMLLWVVARARGRSPVDALPAPWDPEDDTEVPV